MSDRLVAPESVTTQASSRLCGESEMAERIREQDWASSVLGPIATWSETLVATVSLMLASPNAFAVYWGSEGVLLYNDHYRALLHEKHPAALGQKAREVWAEAWAIIGPQIRNAFEHETITQGSEVLIPILAGGKLRDSWFTYGVHPIYENGRVVGVANPGREDTELIQTRATMKASEEQKETAAATQRFLLRLTDAQREAIDGREIMQLSVEMLGQHLDAGRVGFSEAAADLKSMHFETGWAQGDLQRLSGSVSLTHWSEGTSADFSQGRTVIYADVRKEPDLASEVENYEKIGAVAVVAVPFLRRGVWRGSLYVNDARPRQWHPEEVNLIEQVAQRTAEAVERAQAEEELRLLADRLLQEQEHLTLTLQATQASAFDWELATNDVRWTSRLPFGRDAQQLAKPEDIFALMHPEDRSRVQQAVRKALAEQPGYTLEYRALWPDDSVHWMRSSAVVLRDGQGAALRLLGIDTDITERKQAEAALMQTEKLAAVGRLSASIAHEINNPLESVTNLLYLARTSQSLKEVHTHLDTAERELRRVAVISNQTLRFHKQSTASLEVTCSDLFEGVLSIYQGRLMNSQIEVQKRKRAHRSIECFDGEIRQVLNNLVGNAIDAMHPQGGRLLIRSREAYDWRTEERGIVLTVADTGTGMPPQVLRKIFEAFYTTKGIGGTGLGLWVSKEIVDRHHGALRVRSSNKKGHSGTVFALFLPFNAVSR